MEELEYFDAETVVIPMEDGEEQECAILEIFEANGKKYIVVAPIEGDEISDDDAYIYGYEEDGEDIVITNIEDDDEFEMASKAYDELCASEE